MTQRPLIMITNDDGIQARGIRFLAELVKPLGDVVVVAPDAPRSGGSAAITCAEVLRVKRWPDLDGVQMWAVNGTPVDCVKLGAAHVVPRKPDLLLSGINHGANTGNSVVYSGTMGATLEGCMQKINSIGFSLLSHKPEESDFEACAESMLTIVKAVLEKGLPKGVCLNVNMPAGQEVKGIRQARSCKGLWTEEYVRYTDPFGGTFYMLSGDYLNEEPEAVDTDLYWLSKGYVSVVPTVPNRDYDQELGLF